APVPLHAPCWQTWVGAASVGRANARRRARNSAGVRMEPAASLVALGPCVPTAGDKSASGRGRLVPRRPPLAPFQEEEGRDARQDQEEAEEGVLGVVHEGVDDD